LRSYTKDVADPGTVAHVRAIDLEADTNNVAGRGDGGPRKEAHGDVPAAVAVTKRADTQGDVGAARGVVQERSSSGSRVVLACCVGDKGVITDRCVAIGSAGGQRLITDGGIAATGDVLVQRKNAIGGVPYSIVIVFESPKTGSRVSDAANVMSKRQSSNSRVTISAIQSERSRPDGRVEALRAVSIERSVTDSCVLMACSVVIEREATNAGVQLPRCVAHQTLRADGRIEVAGAACQCIKAYGRAAGASSVSKKGFIANGRVAEARGIAKESERSICGVEGARAVG